MDCLTVARILFPAEILMEHVIMSQFLVMMRRNDGSVKVKSVKEWNQ